MLKMANRKKFRGNGNNIVILTIDELDDLVYSATYRAANKATTNLYKGLSSAYLNRFDDDFRTVLDEIEQIKLRLDSKGVINDDTTTE